MTVIDCKQLLQVQMVAVFKFLLCLLRWGSLGWSNNASFEVGGLRTFLVSSLIITPKVKGLFVLQAVFGGQCGGFLFSLAARRQQTVL